MNTSSLMLLGLLSGIPILSFAAALVDDPELHDLLVQYQNRETTELVINKVDLECIYYRSAIVDHLIKDAGGQPLGLFTSVRSSWSDYKLYPNIVMRENHVWKRLPIPHLHDGWIHVHASPDLQTIVAITENQPEVPGWHANFLISHDTGKSWQMVEGFRKYGYFNTIQHFALNDRGEGFAVEYNDGNWADYEKIGYFVYHTDDWGLSWSSAEFQNQFEPIDPQQSWSISSQIRTSDKQLREVDLPEFTACADESSAQ